jgi:hypothetical protein
MSFERVIDLANAPTTTARWNPAKARSKPTSGIHQVIISD